MSVKTLLKIMRPLVIFTTICFFLVSINLKAISFFESAIIAIIAIITAIKMILTSLSTLDRRVVYAREPGVTDRFIGGKAYARMPGVSITMFFVLVFVWLGLDFVEGIILGFIVGPVIVRIFAKMCFRSLKEDQAVTLDFIRTETNVHEADIQAEAEIGWSGKIYLSITLLNQTLQEQTGMGSRQGFENHVDILHDIELQGETLRGDRHPPSYASHSCWRHDHP